MSNVLNLGKDLYIKGRIGWKGLKKEEYLEKGTYKIINATALEDGLVDWSNCGFISKERYEESPEIMLQENDLLISKDGTLGKIGYVKNITSPCTVASGIFVLRNTNKNKINFDYLYYLLTSHIFKDFIIRNKAEGSTINHLYQRDLENFEVELPDIETQEKIASTLKFIDLKIHNNNTQIQVLESLVQTIYDYWFVQFDFPNKETKPYKSNEGKMVWNDVLKRNIPENWQAVPLNNWLNIKSGFPFDSDTYKKLGKYKIITIKNVQDGVLVTTGCDYVDEIPPKAKDYVSLKIGDRLISLTGNCGRLCVVSETNLLLNQRVGLLDCSEDMLEYTYQLLKSPYMKKKAEYLANGAAQANLSPIDLCNIYAILPPKDVIYAFNDIVANIRSKIIKCTQEITNLTSLREDLLPLLINGQVTINS